MKCKEKFSHYRRAVGALVVYDVTKEETFINAKRWMEELKASAEPDCVMCLVGNQVDRVEMNPALRQVTKERAEQFANQNGIKFEETSALTNSKVTDVFDNLLHCKLDSLRSRERSLERRITLILVHLCGE